MTRLDLTGALVLVAFAAIGIAAVALAGSRRLATWCWNLVCRGRIPATDGWIHLIRVTAGLFAVAWIIAWLGTMLLGGDHDRLTR